MFKSKQRADSRTVIFVGYNNNLTTSHKITTAQFYMFAEVNKIEIFWKPNVSQKQGKIVKTAYR